MPKTTLAIFSTVALLTLAGCDEAPECPAPTAEPAKTATPAVSVAQAAPSSAPPAVSVSVSKKTEPVVDEVDDAECSGCDLDADLYVKRLVLARGVKDREPLNAAESFAKSEGKRIYAFVEVGNRDQAASEVYVSFRPKGGKERGRIRLRIGASPRWRTWAYTELATEVGEWEATVFDARGNEIGKQSFHVSEAPLPADPYEEAASPAPVSVSVSETSR